MNLIELVGFFRNGGELDRFCSLMNLDYEAEVIEVFMEKPFALDKELYFFEIEKTNGKIEYAPENVVYHNLFDMFFFLDAIAESKEEPNGAYSDLEISNKLLNYAINDA